MNERKPPRSRRPSQRLPRGATLDEDTGNLPPPLEPLPGGDPGDDFSGVNDPDLEMPSIVTSMIEEMETNVEDPFSTGPHLGRGSRFTGVPSAPADASDSRGTVLGHRSRPGHRSPTGGSGVGSAGGLTGASGRRTPARRRNRTGVGSSVEGLDEPTMVESTDAQELPAAERPPLRGQPDRRPPERPAAALRAGGGRAAPERPAPLRPLPDRPARTSMPPTELPVVRLPPRPPRRADSVAGVPEPSDPSEVTNQMRLPGLIDGRYQIITPIGEGGMGRVLKVRHRALGKDFALKIVRAQLSDDWRAREAFFREARTMSSLAHPNIVTVTDFGVDPGFGAFIVMEFLTGASLLSRVTREGRLPIKAACDIILQCAEAVRFIHSHNIIHCDLKSENVFLYQPVAEPRRRNLVKLLDFGLSRAWEGSKGTDRTREKEIAGTPTYLAPERIEGRPPAPSNDIYALGVLFYEMITGRPPFVGSIAQVLDAHLDEQPLPPSRRLGEHIEERADELILKALAKDPLDRQRDAAAFVYEVRTLMDMLGIQYKRRLASKGGAPAPASAAGGATSGVAGAGAAAAGAGGAAGAGAGGAAGAGAAAGAGLTPAAETAAGTAAVPALPVAVVRSYQDAFDACPLPLFVLGPGGDFKLANRALARLLALQPADLPKQTLATTLGRHNPHVVNELKAAVATVRPAQCQVELLREGRHQRAVLWLTPTVRDGRVAVVHGVMYPVAMPRPAPPRSG